MKLSSLVEAGLSEELAKKVLDMHEDSIKDKFVPIHRLKEETTKVENLQAEVATRDEQLQGLEKLSSDNKELSEQLNKIKAENEAQTEKMEAEKIALKKTNALTSYFASDTLEFKPVDKDDILSNLDLDKITLNEDGTLSGIEEQYKTLTESKPHWFTKKSVETKPRFKGMNPADSTGSKIEPNDEVKLANDLAKFMHGVNAE